MVDYEPSMTYDEMKKALLEASDSYYNKSFSTMTDDDFDALKDEFKTHWPEDPFLSAIGAPVPENSQWKKVKHKIPMCSCNKVNTVDEFIKWLSDNNALNEDVVSSEKLDGLSISVEYDNGKFVSGTTRGDGKEGEDISPNVIRMRNVPSKLPDNITVCLRGEIMMTIDDFKSVNLIQSQRGKKLFQNVRNAASGIARRLDGEFAEYLHVRYYYASGNFVSKKDMFDFIEHKLNLETSPHYYGNKETAILVYNEYEQEKRSLLNYEIDGLVVELNDLDLQKKLGLLNDNIRAQIAWKFSSAKARTRIKNVEWQLGGTKRVTPVAILEPTHLSGVTIKKASIHNYDMFESYNFHENDLVLIERCGDVIPGIISNLSDSVGNERGQKIKPPEKCPACGMKLTTDGVYLVCSNDSCTGGKIGDLEKWIKTLELKGIAGATVEKLYEAGLIKEPADLYRLHEDQISGLEGFGESSAKKIVEIIRNKMEITFPELLGGLNIPNIGRRIGKTLEDAGYDDYNKIVNLSPSKIAEVHGLGLETAGMIVDGLKKKKKIIENLVNVGITIKEKVVMTKSQSSGSSLSGKSFCFTGAIQKIDDDGKRFTRDMMEDLVRSNGGSVSSVKNGLTYLVQADPTSTSTKTKKALALGVEILSEENFFKMIGM